jgi:hypothetical protein
MTISSPVFTAVSRLALPAAVLLLFAGCQTPTPTVAVISPPPPMFGSTPIAAYDAYALALKPQVGTPRADHSVLITSR